MMHGRGFKLLILWLVAFLLTGCGAAAQGTAGTPLDLTSPESVSVALSDLLSRFLLFFPRLVAAILLFIITIYLATWISRIVRHVMKRRRTDPGMTLLVYHTTRWTLIIVGTISALRQVNFDVTAFLAGLGILGFTVGFALQDISQNVVAGLLLLIQKPFELGDLVQLEEFTGTVLSVDLRSTELRTRDGQNVLIPNASVFTTPIINYSRQATWRISVTIGVAYDSDLETVQRVTQQVVQTLPDVLDDPPPEFFYHTFNDSSIDFTLHYWIDGRITNPFTAKHPVIIAIQKAYAKAGIEIPYPIQTEIQMTGE